MGDKNKRNIKKQFTKEMKVKYLTQVFKNKQEIKQGVKKYEYAHKNVLAVMRITQKLNIFLRAHYDNFVTF